MECCLLDLAKNEVQSLVNLAKNEAQYLCCFKSHVETFDQKKKILEAKHQDVKRKFQKGKGVFTFKFEARQWEQEADGIIHIDTKIKKKLFFGWCPNCWWQYRRGKELAEKTRHIEELLGRCNSNIVAGRANISDIKHLSSQNFIHFESRESEFQDLIKALQDKNFNMIGLQGIGGAGKTSMAKEVGHKLKESKIIEKFIFLVVSKPPDFKKIRCELAKGLDLNLEEVKEEELSNTICSRITNMNEKLLIILDDVWEKFDLTENLGIPFDHQHKRYSLLITTRDLRVCSEMGCRTIKLQMLTDEEALDLFEAHATINDSSRGLKGMPQKIVKRCGGVPVAVVAIAKALKNQPTSVWKDALKTLEDRSVDQNLAEAYKCLKLSYDNLKNQNAKEILLIASLFTEDCEIPIQLLSKIGIGLGSFGGNEKYHLERSKVHGDIMELIDSSLLLNGEDECIKMHDLVREVALWIGDKDIQSLIDVKIPIKENLRYILWKNDDFPDEFDGNKLEVLLICLDGLKNLNVSDTFFKEMMRLKVLVVGNEDDKRIPALSLTNSLQPLKDIQTLILGNLELGDISIFGNLLSLETLWFDGCSIIELPSEFLKLKNLRSLEVERCKIEKNNPFEVIERCSKLEELTFVGNECDDVEKDAIFQNGSPLMLHRYCISSDEYRSDYFEKYGSMSRCYGIDGLCHLVSDSTFKQLVGRAELLIVEGKNAQRIWKNLLPAIVPIDEGGMMNDLIVLHLSSCPNMECLINTKDHDDYYGVTAFCNMVELHLLEMDVEELCQGPLPSEFLEQLESMKLKKCHKLKSILFNGNYNLCHLQSMELKDCPKLTSVFQPSTASSLMQLEELTITSCSALEYIVLGEDSDNNQESYYESLFPKLKIFQIAKCNKLRIIFSILVAGGLASLEKISIRESEKLEYIFDKFQEGEDAVLPSLKELEFSRVPSLSGICREYHQLMSSSVQKPSAPLSRHNSNNINQSAATSAFSWVQACCSLNKSRSSSKETNIIAVSEHTSLGHTKSAESDASTDGVPPLHAALSLLVLSLKNVRKIELTDCLNLISLSTLSIAASTISLRNLTISRCHKLKCITTHEGDAQLDKSYCSVFPTLEYLEIQYCEKLELLFLSTISFGLENLKYLTIKGVPELIYVAGSYQNEQHSSNQNQNQNQNDDELHCDLPALEILHIEEAPKINSICAKNYKPMLPSLQTVEMRNCSIRSFTDCNMVNWRTTQELHAFTNGAPLFHKAQSLLIQSLKNIRRMKLVNCANLTSVATLSIASTILLEDLTIEACHHLKCIVAYEGDTETRINYNSIFPKLKWLIISECDALEYLLPAYAFRCPASLEYLSIYMAPMLKYVFGKSQHEASFTHENQNIQTHIDFPALKNLSITHVPQLVSICPKNYYLRVLLLWSIYLEKLPELTMRHFNEFFVCGHAKQEETKAIEMSLQTLEYLIIWGSKIEVIFDLTHVEIEKNGDGLEPLTSSLQQLNLRHLNELANICVGPKCIISFRSLQKLIIYQCKKLKVIFSASTVRSLPMLQYLYISECEELVHIVEDNYEINEPCFPNLVRVYVSNCDKLKYLFSITFFDILPKLRYLQTREAYELEHVLIKRGNEKEMVMKDDVLPQLRYLILTELPNLVSVCQGIDFQMLKEDKYTKVCGCPKFSFYETSTTGLQAGPETADSQVEEKSEEKLSSHQSLNMEEATQQSLTKEDDELVGIEVENEVIMMGPSAIGAENLRKKVPIHTCPNLTAIPTRDDSHASAKIFEKEEEEEEEGGLITSRRPRSGRKASSSLPENKLETFVHDDAQVRDKSRPHSTTSFEGVHNWDINEANMVQSESNSNVETSNLTERELDSSYSKDSQPRRATPTCFGTISQDESLKIVEVRAEESASLDTPHPSCLTSKKEPNPESPNPTVLPRSPSTTAKIFEEEEKGGLITTQRHLSDMKVVISLPVGKEHKTSNHGNPFVPPMPIISSEQEASNTILPLSLKQIPMSTPSESTYGQLADMAPSIYDTNDALRVAGVKEIVDIMKLDGVEPFMLAEAFKTNSQLRLSLEDRSTELLCYSYRVLLNILNILATRSPFTITEADKRLLAKYLKDASVLGFDNDWLQSIRIKVFSWDASEVHHKQRVLESLGHKLQANKRELAIVRDQEAKAAQSVEMAQKEMEATQKELEAAYKGLEAAQSHFNVAQQNHANIRVRHCQLLEDCQEILEQRDQCSEIIAAKLQPFGF